MSSRVDVAPSGSRRRRDRHQPRHFRQSGAPPQPSSSFPEVAPVAAPVPANDAGPAKPRSPRTDQLDQPIRVLSPQLLAGLAALAIATAAAVVWGFLGNLPQRVAASGVLSGHAGVRLAQAPQVGSVTAVLVPTGRRVVAGQGLVVLSTTSGRAVVDAPVAGTVVQTFAIPGEQVAAGTPLESIEPVGPVNRALLFLSSRQVSVLRRGDPVAISAGAALIDGTVAAINPVPVSKADIVTQFGTAAAPGLPSTASPTFEVVVELRLPPSAPVLPPFAEIRGSILIGSQPPYKTLVG
jgi:biotin carboxyl carrier protein